MMDGQAKIYVAGHRGLVGSAIMRALEKQGYTNIIFRTHAELDLTDTQAVKQFFEIEKPEYVFFAAAKVGGIQANNIYPADFIRENINIQQNLIHQAYLTKVKRLLFLGSSCIYPKDCPQPIKEEYLLTGLLEPTNRPYALAKIAGIEMCWAYNRQYGTKYLAAMPTNLYGQNDNYNLQNSHVLPALIRKFHEAKIQNKPYVEAWGTGKPRREFLCSDDMADACLFLMNLPEEKYSQLVQNEHRAPLINVGCGEDVTIEALTELVKKVTSYQGDIKWDATKPDGTMRKLMDVEKLRGLGWCYQMSLETGVALAYQDFQKDIMS